MKRIAAMRSACLAAAGLVAAGALVYGLAFVAFPQFRSRVAYRDPGARPLRPPPPRPDVRPIWETKLGNVVEIKEPPRFDGTLAGTTISSDPAKSFIAVNGPGGQSLLHAGDRYQGFHLANVGPGTAVFSYGGDPLPPINIDRSPKLEKK